MQVVENSISSVVVCSTHVFSIALKGLFPKEAFPFLPYTQPDQLGADIQAYKMHMAFPVNGEVAHLLQNKGVIISKVFSSNALASLPYYATLNTLSE